MLWIAVHLPQLSLESFAATVDPAWRGRPLALIEAHRITQVDARAAACGIQPGAKRATALMLAPDLVLGQADAARDALALQAVAHAALAFTPMVCLQSEEGATTGAGAPAPVVLLEVQASLRCFGGFRQLLAHLRRALQPLGHHLCLASAPTPLGAALLARWRADLIHGPHSVDLTALRRLLDDAPVWLLGPGREQWCPRAAQTPPPPKGVTKLGSGPSFSLEALQGMGLRQLSDLHHLPRAGLARRFGPALLADLDRARGDAPDPREPIVPPPVFAQRIELFSRADNAEQLMAGARVLIARLLAWARAHCSRVARFTLRMHHESSRRDVAAPSCSELVIGLAEPSVDAAHLQSLLAERLARLPLAAPALELSLHCDALVRSSPPNGELFPTRGTEHEGLTRLVERLQARLGAEGVQRLELVADHRPERAAAWAPAEAAAPVRAVAAGLEPAAGTPPRPLWLLREPMPLPERGSRPWLDGTPLQLLAGPERIESGWWDGDLAARDYFIARAIDGALVWVFRARLPLGSTPGRSQVDPPPSGGGGRLRSPAGTSNSGAGWFLQGRFA